MVKSYNSAANDVWSLGVILINLVFGRNPWKQAYPRDETFSAYILNNDFLQTILPMSSELNEIIKAVFCLNPRKRISLKELEQRVLACGSFTVPDFMPPPSNPPASGPAAAAMAAGPGGGAMVSASMVAQAVTAAQVARTALGSPRPDDKLFNNGDKEDSGVDLRSMA